MICIECHDDFPRLNDDRLCSACNVARVRRMVEAGTYNDATVDKLDAVIDGVMREGEA